MYAACKHIFIAHEVKYKQPYNGCHFLVKVIRDGDGMCTNCIFLYSDARVVLESLERRSCYSVPEPDRLMG